jgi:CubicO group peptidase (beta-lactamase class C family)
MKGRAEVVGMRMPQRVAVVGVVLSVLVAGGCGGSSDSPPAKPSAATGAAGRLAVVLKSDARFDSVRAVVVTVNGKKVFERYRDTTPDVHRNIYSMTKSVMAALVGVAIGDHKISGTSATLAELLPRYARSMPTAVAHTTLAQVLTMRAGFPGEEDPDAFAFLAAKDPTQAILDSTAGHRLGTYAYSPSGAHLLSAIISATTGRSVLDYARAKLFRPLGIVTTPAAEPVAVQGYNPLGPKTFTWLVDRAGHNTGWSELALTAEDLSKLGNLYLNGGRWNGKQIVPAAYVRESTTGRVPFPDQIPIDSSYGYMWWTGQLRGHPGFGAVGFGGQRIMVIPDRRVVVVVVVDAYMNDPGRGGIEPPQSAEIADAILMGLAEH